MRIHDWGTLTDGNLHSNRGRPREGDGSTEAVTLSKSTAVSGMMLAAGIVGGWDMLAGAVVELVLLQGY